MRDLGRFSQSGIPGLPAPKSYFTVKNVTIAINNNKTAAVSLQSSNI